MCYYSINYDKIVKHMNEMRRRRKRYVIITSGSSIAHNALRFGKYAGDHLSIAMLFDQSMSSVRDSEALTCSTMRGKCRFQDGWVTNPAYAKWIARAPSDGDAVCRYCKKSFDVSNMGESALRSHAKSKKHIDLSQRGMLLVDSVSKKRGNK